MNVKTTILFPIHSEVNATVLISEENDTTSSLGLYLSKLGLTQARIASKDNYDNVTYYFNGEITEKLTKCTNYLIESPIKDKLKEKDLELVSTAKQTIKCMEKDIDFILTSISAIDELGHTGDLNKTVKMLELFDLCLGKIIENAELNFYTIVLLSTHGNVEEMINENDKYSTVNTNNPVPFVITDSKLKLVNGTITGVAPTILEYMDISIPEAMKESKLLIKN